MKFSFNWLKEFVEISLNPKALAKQLTLAGLEVNHIEKKEGDYLFDVEVTPNRPDLLSHLGVARETAAVLGRTFKFPRWLKRQMSIPRIEGEAFPIQIENDTECTRYVGIVIEGVKIGPSPKALAEKLERLGTRSINNVVDVTNLCLYETGQPLHAFDLDKLEGAQIHVRRAKAGEKFMTLDEEECKLDPELLVIADAQKPVALAGVMGGLDTGVTESTTRILLEAAQFNPSLVRRAVRKTKIITDSSYRFERGVDISLTPQVAVRAARWIMELAGGTMPGGLTDVKTTVPSKRSISLRPNRVQEVLGMRIYPSQQKRLLERIGCKVSGTVRGFRVEPPAYRQDLQIAEDLNEELARLWGYDRCEPTLAPISRRPVAEDWSPVLDDWVVREKALKRILAASGLYEMMSYSLLSREVMEKAGVVEAGTEELLKTPIGIQNPLSSEQAYLRTALLPGTLTTISLNLRRKSAQAFRLFEVGHIYRPDQKQQPPSTAFLGGGHPCEQRALSVAFAGTPEPLWGQASEPLGIFHLKGALTKAFGQLQLGELQTTLVETEHPTLQTPYMTLQLQDQAIGEMGLLKPDLLDRWDIEMPVAYANINLDTVRVLPEYPTTFVSLAKVAPVERDLAIIVTEDITCQQVTEIIEAQGKPLLSAFDLFDVYRGKQIDSGHKSLGFRLQFSDGDKTLTDKEVTEIYDRIVAQLGSTFNAKQRLA